MPIEYIFALIAAIGYALSALFLKRALNEGAGTFRITFLLNWIMVLLFLPLLYWNCNVCHQAPIWPIIITGVALFCAQLLVFAGIQSGDVSVFAPVLGTKVLFVGYFASKWIPSAHVPLFWLPAAFLSIAAVGLSVVRDPAKSKATGTFRISLRSLKTAIFALLAAMSFAVADVVIEGYSPGFGEIPFLVLSMFCTALLSLGLIPFFEGKLFSMPKAAWNWQLLGNLFMAVEALIFYCSISFYGNATGVNLVYASRGIWSIALVALIGGFIGLQESSQSLYVKISRTLGALAFLGSITLASF